MLRTCASAPIINPLDRVVKPEPVPDMPKTLPDGLTGKVNVVDPSPKPNALATFLSVCVPDPALVVAIAVPSYVVDSVKVLRVKLPERTKYAVLVDRPFGSDPVVVK